MSLEHVGVQVNHAASAVDGKTIARDTLETWKYLRAHKYNLHTCQSVINEHAELNFENVDQLNNLEALASAFLGMELGNHVATVSGISEVIDIYGSVGSMDMLTDRIRFMFDRKVLQDMKVLLADRKKRNDIVFGPGKVGRSDCIYALYPRYGQFADSDERWEVENLLAANFFHKGRTYNRVVYKKSITVDFKDLRRTPIKARAYTEEGIPFDATDAHAIETVSDFLRLKIADIFEVAPIMPLQYFEGLAIARSFIGNKIPPEEFIRIYFPEDTVAYNRGAEIECRGKDLYPLAAEFVRKSAILLKTDTYGAAPRKVQ